MRTDYKKYKIKNKKNINVRIAHISDIHFSHEYKIKRLKMIKQKIQKMKPDYICITGDLVDIYDVIYDTNFNEFTTWLKEISEIAKTIISIGNHEYIKLTETGCTKTNDISWLKKLQTERLIVLDNEIYNDNNITFIGYNPDFDYYYKDKENNPHTHNKYITKLIKKANKEYTILLLHTPMLLVNKDNYKKIENFKNIDLVLSGHTHGGLIPSFIPGNFGIVSPHRKLFPKKVRGKIKLETNNIIISSGVMKLSRKSKLTYLNDIYGTNINEINIQSL